MVRWVGEVGYAYLMRILSISTGFSFAVSLVLDLAAGVLLTSSIPLLGNFLTLTLSRNTGVAFGVRLPSPWQELIIFCALIGVTTIAIRSKCDRMQKDAHAVGFGIIIGGALANLVDRLIHGYVTDFIAVGTFPIFIVADACISIGAGMLILENLKKKSILSA